MDFYVLVIGYITAKDAPPNVPPQGYKPSYIPPANAGSAVVRTEGRG